VLIILPLCCILGALTHPSSFTTSPLLSPALKSHRVCGKFQDREEWAHEKWSPPFRRPLKAVMDDQSPVPMANKQWKYITPYFFYSFVVFSAIFVLFFLQRFWRVCGVF
jgi:hypothetical protein